MYNKPVNGLIHKSGGGALPTRGNLASIFPLINCSEGSHIRLHNFHNFLHGILKKNHKESLMDQKLQYLSITYFYLAGFYEP